MSAMHLHTVPADPLLSALSLGVTQSRASAAGTLTRSSVALPQSPDLPIASVRSRAIPRDAEYSRRCCCPPTCFLFSLCSVEVDLCGSKRIFLYLPSRCNVVFGQILRCSLRQDVVVSNGKSLSDPEAL